MIHAANKSQRNSARKQLGKLMGIQMRAMFVMLVASIQFLLGLVALLLTEKKNAEIWSLCLKRQIYLRFALL